MSMDPAIAAAKANAVAARARLEATVQEMQSRLNPSAIVHGAWSDMVDRGADAWDVAVDRGAEALSVVVDRGSQATEDAAAFVRRRPGLSAAAATAAIALVAGPPLVRRALRKPPPEPPVAEALPRLTGPIPHLETRP